MCGCVSYACVRIRDQPSSKASLASKGNKVVHSKTKIVVAYKLKDIIVIFCIETSYFTRFV